MCALFSDVSSEDEAASSLFNMTTASNQPGNKQKGVVSHTLTLHFNVTSVCTSMASNAVDFMP